MPTKRVVVFGTRSDYLIRHRGPLMRDLVNRGHEVWALAPNISEDQELTLRAGGVRSQTVQLDAWSLNPVTDGVLLASLYHLFRRIRPDIVFSYATKPIVYGTLAASLARVERRVVLFAGLGYLFSDGPGLRRRILRRGATWGFKGALLSANIAFFQNADDRQRFVDLGVVPLEKTGVVPGSGVDLEAFESRPIPPPPVRFIMATRLLREKGVYEYIEAARRIKAKHPEVEFLLLGATDQNPGAVNERHLHEAVREGSITWPGEVGDVRPWLESSSVFVLPSYYGEGVPRGALEAMAVGRPIVTTGSVGCRETVEVSRNGLLVPPRDVDSLVDALRSLVLDFDVLVRMGKESRRIAEDRFDVRHVNAILMQSMGA